MSDSITVVGVRQHKIKALPGLSGPEYLSTSGCIKIPYKGFEISIAADNSCGTSPILFRVSMCVFSGPQKNSTNITRAVLGVDEIYDVTIEDIVSAKRKIDRAIKAGTIVAEK